MQISAEQRAVLVALDDVARQSIGYRMGPFRRSTGVELVHLGLAESRKRERKPGARVFRRAPAGRELLTRSR
jgi:hypothetical protein